MDIIVSSRMAVSGVVLKIQKNAPDSKVVVISITDPKSDPVNLPVAYCDILRLSFHDLDRTYPISCPAIVLFNKDMARQIKDFIVDHLCYNGTTDSAIMSTSNNMFIVVHCEAGISRSSGVAGALAKHFIGDDFKFFKYPYLPNRLAYSVLLNMLNGRENIIPNVIIDEGSEENNIFG